MRLIAAVIEDYHIPYINSLCNKEFRFAELSCNDYTKILRATTKKYIDNIEEVSIYYGYFIYFLFLIYLFVSCSLFIRVECEDER